MITAATHRVPEPAAQGTREAWIDNLRLVVIVGVIAAHVSMIYALDVGWYYEERTARQITKVALAAVFSPGLLFGMGLLFFVAGLFAPQAFERKGARRFAIDRLWRLGLPTVAYFFVVDPAMNFFGDRAAGEGKSVSDYFHRTYWDDVEFGVAWFITALLAFSISYAAWRWSHPARHRDVGPLQRRDLVQAATFIFIASFAVRIVWPFLQTDEMWGLNLWEYPQMLALFVLGALAAERGWLTNGLTDDLRRTCGRAGVVGLVLAALTGALIAITDNPDPWVGGFRLEALLIPMVEATLTLGMSLWAVDWFRRRWNHANPLVGRFGRGSFTAFLVHPPITVILGVVLRDVAVPAEAKLLAVTALTVGTSFGLGALLTRQDRSARIL